MHASCRNAGIPTAWDAGRYALPAQVIAWKRWPAMLYLICFGVAATCEAGIWQIIYLTTVPFKFSLSTSVKRSCLPPPEIFYLHWLTSSLHNALGLPPRTWGRESHRNRHRRRRRSRGQSRSRIRSQNHRSWAVYSQYHAFINRERAMRM